MDESGSGYILVTERVPKLFRKHRITNRKFQPIEEVELLAVQSEIQRIAR